MQRKLDTSGNIRWTLLGIAVIRFLLACTPQIAEPQTPTLYPVGSQAIGATDSVLPSIDQSSTADNPNPSPEFPESTETADSDSEALATQIIDSVGHPMTLIPAGQFEMGSENEEYPQEQPRHLAYLDQYYFDLYEVTNDQFARFLNEQGNQLDHGERWIEIALSSIEQIGEMFVSKTGFEDHPVIMVRWHGANAYCQWREARLPTEAEWEKAARGENGRTYPWGDSLDGAKANFCDINCEFEHANSQFDDGYTRTSPVGSYPDGRSPYGVFDMAGNVWEWVADWSGDYLIAPEFNPTGPDDGEWKVLKGGSWGDLPDLLRASFRNANAPNASYIMDGFRCARSP